MSGEDLTSAATLSLEIDTGGAEAKLFRLAEAYGLFVEALSAAAPANGLKDVGAGAHVAATGLKAAHDEALEAKAALAAVRAAAEQTATGLKTSLSAASSSIGNSIKVPEEVLSGLNSRMKRAGEEAIEGLSAGLTKPNYKLTQNLLAGVEENTVASLSRVKKLVDEARDYSLVWGKQNAQIQYGGLATDDGFAAGVASKKAAAEALERQKILSSAIIAAKLDQEEKEKAIEVAAAQRRIEMSKAISVAVINARIEQERVLSSAIIAAKFDQDEKEKAAAVASMEKRIAMDTAITRAIVNARIEQQKTISSAIIAARMAEDDRELASIEAANSRKLALERQYVLASQSQRLKAAIDARKLIDSGHTGDMTLEFPSAVLSNAHANPLATLEKQYVALNPSVKNATEHQLKWNATASESHAVARGLSGSLGQLWMTYGQIAPLLAGAALGSSFKSAMEKGAEFEYQLTFVKALGGESAEAVRDLSSAALSLGSTGMKGPVEMASGLRILAQAGIKASEAIMTIPHVANLAIVGEMGMEAAAVTLVGVMEAFKLHITDISRVGDVFAKAAAVSQTSVSGMTEAMKTASVVGTQYGVSMEDAATAITLLAKVNIHGTAAGTSLRNMLKELYAPGKQAADTLKMLGVSASDGAGNLKPMAEVIYSLKDKLVEYDKVSQVNILQRLFGERGAKEAIAMLSLTRGEWEKLHDQITNSSGFMGQVAAELEMTTKGVFTQAKNILEADLIGAFEKTDGAAHALAVSLRDLFASEKFKSDIAGLVEAMSGLATILVKISPLVLYGAEAWAAWKIIPIVAAGLAKISAVAATVTAAIGSLVDVVAVLAAGLGSAGAASVLAMSAMDGLVAACVAVTTPAIALAAALGSVYLAYKAWNDATPQAIKDADTFTSALDRQIDKVKEENVQLEKRLRLLRTGSDEDPNLLKKQISNLKSEKSINLQVLDDTSAPFWVKGMAAKYALEADEKIRDMEAKSADLAGQARTKELNSLAVYGEEKLKILKDIEYRASKAKKDIDTSSVKSLIASLKVGMSQDEKDKRRIDIEDAINELNTGMLGKGKKHVDFGENKKDSMRAIVADLEGMKHLVDAEIQHRTRMIDLALRGHEMSAARAADLKGELALQQALMAAEIARKELETLRSKPGTASKTDVMRAEAKYKVAEQNVGDTKAENAQRTLLANETLFARLDKLEVERLGKQKRYADQYSEFWKDNLEQDQAYTEAYLAKLTLAFADLMAKGEYEAASAIAAQMSVQKALADRLAMEKQLGSELASKKDQFQGANTTVKEMQTAMAKIDHRPGKGLLHDLMGDIEKTAILNSKIQELQKLVVLSDASTPDDKKRAAELSASIEKLQNEAGKGSKALFSDVERGLTSAIEAGFENGKSFSAKSFIKSVRSQLASAMFKMSIQAVVNPVMGALTGGGGGGGSLLGSVLQMAGSWFAGSIGGGGGGGGVSGPMSYPNTPEGYLPFPGRASGGPVSPGGMYRVNELGPEMFSQGGKDYLMMGGQGGFVKPVSQSAVSAGAAAGGNIENNVTVSVSIESGNVQADTNTGAALGHRIESAVRAVLVAEKRAGGMLAN